jgi:hypothetical protein
MLKPHIKYRNPDHLAYAIDALTIPWNNMFAYADPPICLIPKILQHITQYNCQLILIAPHCQRRIIGINFPSTTPAIEFLKFARVIFLRTFSPRGLE